MPLKIALSCTCDQRTPLESGAPTTRATVLRSTRT
jgi:hypothetical protein